jgi:hypothetical protein
MIAGSNPLPDNTYGDSETPFARGFAQPTGFSAIEPDLEAVIAAWPDLPEHIRQAVLALVGTVTATTSPGGS